jgi:hypothetical protein
MLPYFISLFLSLRNGYEEVLNLLIVDLKHRYIYFILFILIGVSLNPSENLLTGNRHYAFVSSITNHGVRFTSSRLSIGEQTTMITFPSIGEYFKSNLFENVLLISIFIGISSKK